MAASGRKGNGRGGWIFLAVVVLLYAITALGSPGLALAALSAFQDMCGQLAVVLALVFALMFLFDLYLDARRVEACLGANSGLRGWFVAIGVGILATGPVYAWYALLGDLRRKGMRPSLAAAFLYARALKLPLLPLLVHYFGLGYTLALSACLVAAAIVSGLFMDWVEHRAARASR